MQIGEPTILARLPRAGLTGDGQTRFCQVYGVRHGQRKKRQELCAAVDGNSLNIYEVVNGRNIASWPVPPDTAFVCPPVSERHLQQDGNFARRSWCVVRRQGQLIAQCFEEKKTSAQTDVHSTKTYPLPNNTEVLCIAPALTDTDGATVTYSDGTIVYITTDKTQQTTKTKAVFQGAYIRILSAYCMSTDEAAAASILKSRQDLLTGLPISSQVLIAVISVPQAKSLHVACWKISPPVPDSTLEPLLIHDLSTFNISRKASVDFATGGKHLRAIEPHHTTYIDLTTIVPQKVSERKITPPEQKQALTLTPEIDAHLRSGELRLVNHKFGSVLASRRVDDISLKRKRDSETSLSLVPVAYFSQIQRLVVSTTSQIIAIDLISATGSSHDLKRSSMLINNILRGVADSGAPTHVPPRYVSSIGKANTSKPLQDWSLLSKDLDSLVSQNDTDGFVARFSDAFEIQGAADLKSFKYGADKLDFLLSKLFAFDSIGSRGLYVRLVVPKLLKWSIAAGLLDGYRVARAVGAVPTAVTASAIGQALAHIDNPEMDLMETYVQHSPYLDAEALTFLVWHLISKIRHTSGHETESVAQLRSAGKYENSVGPSSELTRPAPNESIRRNPVTTCLVTALQRLSYTGIKTVSKQLSDSMMQQADIISLIQFLRQQLFQGGFYRMGGSAKYPSPPLSNHGAERDEEKPAQQLSLDTIVRLLNGCIDALGPVGVLGAQEDEPFLRAMVTELCSEIASTSDAVQDSVALQGLVRETLRYVESMESQPFEVRSKVEQPAGLGHEQRVPVKGEIVTLYAEHTAEESGLPSGAALPLSLQAEESGITSHKARRGGQTQRRSAREIGMLRDRLKAPYSFERLVL